MTWRLLGGPGSPYSLKLRALLRYRHIPHVWIVPQSYLRQAAELAEAGKRMIPVLQTPEGDYLADSTPLIRHLDRLIPGRHVMPPDPAAAFLSGLVEDFADEWMVYAMFDSRWSTPTESDWCARRQMSAWLGPMPPEEFDGIVARFLGRQESARAIICGPESNRPIYRASIERLTDAIEHLLDQSQFLFGSRPSSGDFGLFGALSQIAADPAASGILKPRGPRAFQWIQSLDDASGVDGGWSETWPDALRDLLRLTAETHLAFLLRLAGIADRGETATLRFTPFGLPYEVEIQPPRDLKSKGLGLGYRLRSLAALKGELAVLSPADRARIEPLLRDTGCWEALQPRVGEDLSPLPVR